MFSNAYSVVLDIVRRNGNLKAVPPIAAPRPAGAALPQDVFGPANPNPHPVVISCKEARSRSMFITACYLIFRYGMGAMATLEHLKTASQSMCAPASPFIMLWTERDPVTLAKYEDLLRHWGHNAGFY
jgi:hypothetical protein